MKILNKVYFNKELVNSLHNKLPDKFKEFWEIKYNDLTDGCVRTLNNKVIAFYFYINTDSVNRSILKFNFKREYFKEDEIQFDSIYAHNNLKDSNPYQEYRYDVNNNLIAGYNFSVPSGVRYKGNDIFGEQFKKDKYIKNYTYSSIPKTANSSLVKFSKKYLTKELSKTRVDYFHVGDNKKEIYWFIR
jgi:hypothetical protein|tara:strand:- start:163 stop:726 length:564 start_codon:yes stop_codon:yes gene_type:complete